jgi:tRNA(Glu) U13 pseudouridine synthase TruD
MYSADFNERLGDLLEESGPVCVVEDEGISFRMPKEKRTMAPLMAEHFPEERIGAFRIHTLEQDVPRKLLVTTNINFISCEKDEFHPGKSALTVSFFMPMGAYATMAMKQLDIFAHRF